MKMKVTLTTTLLILMTMHSAANAWSWSFPASVHNASEFISKLGTIRNKDFKTKDVMELVELSQSCRLKFENDGYSIYRGVVAYNGKAIRIERLPLQDRFNTWSRNQKLALIDVIDSSCRQHYVKGHKSTIPSDTIRGK